MLFTLFLQVIAERSSLSSLLRFCVYYELFQLYLLFTKSTKGWYLAVFPCHSIIHTKLPLWELVGGMSNVFACLCNKIFRERQTNSSQFTVTQVTLTPEHFNSRFWVKLWISSYRQNSSRPNPAPCFAHSMVFKTAHKKLCSTCRSY